MRERRHEEVHIEVLDVWPACIVSVHVSIAQRASVIDTRFFHVDSANTETQCQ